MTMRIRLSAPAVLLSSCVTLSGPALATEWYAEPSIYWRGEQISNAAMANRDQEDVTGSVLNLAARLGIEGERGTVLLTPQARVARYVPGTEYDRFEARLDFSAARQQWRGQWRIDANFARDTTLTSEWEQTEFVEAVKFRRRLLVTPAWTYETSDVAQVRMAAGFTDVYYEDAEYTVLVGYDYRWVETGYQRDHGERTQSHYSLNASRLRAPRADNVTDDVSVRAGVNYAPHETGRVGLELGAHRSRVEVADRTEWNSGGLLQATYTVELARNQLTASAERSLEPSGIGALLVRDELVLLARHEISGEYAFSAAVRGFLDRGLGDDDRIADRQYQRVEWRLHWDSGLRWSVSGGVNYQRQRYAGQSDAAEGATALIEFGYRGKRRTW
jgi:hypothetical protein